MVCLSWCPKVLSPDINNPMLKAPTNSLLRFKIPNYIAGPTNFKHEKICKSLLSRTYLLIQSGHEENRSYTHNSLLWTRLTDSLPQTEPCMKPFKIDLASSNNHWACTGLNMTIKLTSYYMKFKIQTDKRFKRTLIFLSDLIFHHF